MIVTEKSPAKINLFLHVTGKRDDGYHLLSSLVVFSDRAYDSIIIEPANGFSFEVRGDQNLQNDDNLIVKAAKALSAHTGNALKCKIILEKNLPIAGGVGGGSSNAAAALRALEQYWKNLPFQRNHSIDKGTAFDALLLSLGADVPVCYFNQPCLMRGIGEIIDPLPYALPDFEITLHPSSQQLSTPDVFQAFDKKFAKDIQTHDFPQWETVDDMCQWLLENTENSLEKIALSLSNITRPDTENFTRLSGSGPTFFEISTA